MLSILGLVVAENGSKLIVLILIQIIISWKNSFQSCAKADFYIALSFICNIFFIQLFNYRTLTKSFPQIWQSTSKRVIKLLKTRRPVDK